MNREIKFRGKDRESCWHYGDLVQEIRHNDNKLFDGTFTHIRNFEYKNGDYIGKIFPVIPDTIGQYTGLHDKNGKKIYEGDVVKYRDSTGQHIEKVIFDKGCFYAGMHGGSSTRVAPKLINTRITEVIGNVWEDSDLLNDSENTKSN